MAATVWRGHLTFGLVSIPVRLYPAARAKKVRLNQVYRPRRDLVEDFLEEETARPEPPPERISVVRPPLAETLPAVTVSGPQARVHYTPDAPRTDFDREVVKAFEYEKDRYVTLDKPDLDRLAVKTSTDMEIAEFVKLEEIDPVFFETSYFVAADPGGEKPYALLFAAMRRSGHVGIATVAMHRREHVVILRPGEKGLMLHTMFYADEVRREQEYAAAPDLVTSRELDMAALLVQALTGTFQPEKYKDSYQEKLNALIENRLAGVEKSQGEPAQTAKPVVDIMEALKSSLARLKKPPAAAPAEPKRKVKRAS